MLVALTGRKLLLLLAVVASRHNVPFHSPFLSPDGDPRLAGEE